jgi:hypothetical protein
MGTLRRCSSSLADLAILSCAACPGQLLNKDDDLRKIPIAQVILPCVSNTREAWAPDDVLTIEGFADTGGCRRAEST